jgi:hypothetical protein
MKKSIIVNKNIFSFLFNFKKLKLLNDDSLQKYCLNLESFLKHDIYSHIDGLDLFLELKVLQIEKSTPIDIINYIKRQDYIILLRIHVTIASIEKSFSKLKSIKCYLRLTMSQERLFRLSILYIN